MCGIFCSISKTHHILPDEKILERLKARGPDSTASICAIYPQLGVVTHDRTYITLYSTVLSLRGQQTVPQPYQDADGKLTLCWNGEAWSIDGQQPLGNDTGAVHRLLVDALGASTNDEYSQQPFECARKIANALSRIAGPYAFVLFDHAHGKLFFGRDFLGRRSLMTRTTNGGDVIISSVSDGSGEDGWKEIESDGVYCVGLRPINTLVDLVVPRWNNREKFVATVVPYNSVEAATANSSTEASVTPHLSLNRRLPLFHQRLEVQSSAVTKLAGLLEEAVSKRVLNIPDQPVSSDNFGNDSTRAKLAILFSGGLDCTVLAHISHRLLPHSESIDLLNVAFENPRIHKRHDGEQNASSTAYELCPDRITGRASYGELQRVCCDRGWRFVAINVPYSESQAHRKTVISLMHPHNTEMDLSIANALYFAARGDGSISRSPEDEPDPYLTSARILLSGLGADELFAGYTRHATAYKRNGFSGLLDELELDVTRLGKRNLGRDDRVMSHWGKEVRFPYLDECLLSWALDASVTDKCGFGEPATTELTSLHNDDHPDVEPGKKVLRRLAQKLGLMQVAREKKRAIQFGARTAKMETGKTKGTQLLA